MNDGSFQHGFEQGVHFMSDCCLFSVKRPHYRLTALPFYLPFHFLKLRGIGRIGFKGFTHRFAV